MQLLYVAPVKIINKKATLTVFYVAPHVIILFLLGHLIGGEKYPSPPVNFNVEEPMAAMICFFFFFKEKTYSLSKPTM